MATQPKPPPKPKPDDDDDEPHPPAAGARSPPAPVETIADEQRERSEEIQRTGVEKWKAEHDERGPGDQARQVPGLSPRVDDPGAAPEAGSWAGSTRSTPEARAAQRGVRPPST